MEKNPNPQVSGPEGCTASEQWSVVTGRSRKGKRKIKEKEVNHVGQNRERTIRRNSPGGSNETTGPPQHSSVAVSQVVDFT